MRRLRQRGPARAPFVLALGAALAPSAVKIKKCADGKSQVHAEVKFANGTKAATEAIRSCTPKG